MRELLKGSFISDSNNMIPPFKSCNTRRGMATPTSASAIDSNKQLGHKLKLHVNCGTLRDLPEPFLRTPRFVCFQLRSDIFNAHQRVTTILPRADVRLFIPAFGFWALAAPRSVNVRYDLDARSRVVPIRDKHSRGCPALCRTNGEI